VCVGVAVRWANIAVTVALCDAAAASDAKLISCADSSTQVVATSIPGLSRVDDAAATIDLPFPVSLYGGSYTAATVSTNGWVSFGNDTGAFDKQTNVCNVDTQWPSATCLGTGPVLAVFWGETGLKHIIGKHLPI